MLLDTQGCRVLALAVIKRAQDDMRPTAARGIERRRRLHAALWLASTRATPWFGLADLGQAWSLKAMGWCEAAEEWLQGDELYPAQRALLRDGLREVRGRESAA